MAFGQQLRRHWDSLLTIGLAVGAYLYFNADNINFNSSMLLGLLFAPFIFRRVNRNPEHRLLWLLVPVGILLCFRHSSSLFYCFCGLTVLYAIERNWGRLNALPLFLLALMSSLATHTAYIWSFPIRLQLSEWAARTLSLVGWDAVAEGNVILLNGTAFSVDPACMGLRMLITAGILGLLIMAQVERRYGHRFSFGQTALLLSVLLLLAILANFIRLLALVAFQILPDSFAHDGVGLLSLLVYTLLPFYAFLNFRYRNKAATAAPANEINELRKTGRRRLIYCGLLLLLLANGPKFRQPVSVVDPVLTALQPAGFSTSLVDGGVLKLENEKVLIYVKPPVKAFQGAHDPRICWQGTGYEFTHIRKREIGGTMVYVARLQKNEAQLYTAWWLDDGHERTTAEWRWRWHNLCGGRQFRLVNLTTLHEQDLEKEVLAFWQIPLQ